MRVNLSVAIVYMVAPYNTTDTDQGGPFHWSDYDQGIILGMFFYGYIVTQLPGGRLAELFGGKAGAVHI